MKQLHKRFEKYLSENDSRYTTQKREIAEEIFKSKDHFEVDPFIDKVRQTKDISRATFYRTVKQLLDAGLLQKISTRDGKIFYEKIHAAHKEHAHLICNQCGKILEIKDPALDDFINQHCNKIGFTAEYQSLHVYGLCNNCKPK